MVIINVVLQIVQADKNSKENDNEFANSSNANANNVTESLVGDLNNYRIMCYQDKAPLAPEGILTIESVFFYS